jgi:hypothetical protein
MVQRPPIESPPELFVQQASESSRREALRTFNVLATAQPAIMDSCLAGYAKDPASCASVVGIWRPITRLHPSVPEGVLAYFEAIAKVVDPTATPATENEIEKAKRGSRELVWPGPMDPTTEDKIHRLPQYTLAFNRWSETVQKWGYDTSAMRHETQLRIIRLSTYLSRLATR